MTIINFTSQRQAELNNFVLGIQNGEFGLGFKEDEQLDLTDTTEFYKGGGFWISELNGEIVGCIGLQKLDKNIGILRKMFVKNELRGSSLKIAQNLFEKLKLEAEKIGFKSILLDTPSVAKASHRFYEKNGFLELDRSQIPAEYKFPDRNSKIFELKMME
jgi:N-acetylglutamate synthase-like GNAT family acetyltransferase